MQNLNTSTSDKPSSDMPTISSQQILAGHAVARIEHAGQTYLLRVTRENKLILTK